MNEHREQAEALLDAASRDCLTLQLLHESGRAPNESMGFLRTEIDHASV